MLEEVSLPVINVPRQPMTGANSGYKLPVAAVSYTHLDVYKRQVDARTADIDSCLFGHPSESGEGYDCIHLYVSAT